MTFEQFCLLLTLLHIKFKTEEILACLTVRNLLYALLKEN